MLGRVAGRTVSPRPEGVTGKAMDSYATFAIKVAPNPALCDSLYSMIACSIRVQGGEAKEVSVEYQAETAVAEPDEPLARIWRCE